VLLYSPKANPVLDGQIKGVEKPLEKQGLVVNYI
jgi:hypothetical protein